MPRFSDPAIVRTLRSSSAWTAAGAALIGLMGTVGWIFHIAILKTILPGLVSIKPNTAACFLLAGGTLWFSMHKRETRARNRVSQLAGMIVALVGMLSLMEVISGWTFGIDQFLFRDPLGDSYSSGPGQMAPNTAVCFILLGMAMLLLGARIRKLHSTLQFLAVIAFLVTLRTINGYAFEMSSLYGHQSYPPMALHTCLGFLLLCCAILCYRPSDGAMAVVTSSSSGGETIRRLLPPALVLPPLLGFLYVQAQRVGLYGSDLGFIIQSISNVSFFAILVWWVCQRLHNADIERIHNQREAAQQAEDLARSEQSLRDQTELMQSAFDSMGEGMVVGDENGNLTSWNPVAQRILGDVLGRFNSQAAARGSFFHADEVTPFPASELPIMKAIRGESTDDVELFVRTDASPSGTSVHASGRPLRDQDGKLRGAVVLFRDIGRLKHAEAELRLADARRERFVKELEQRNLEITQLGRMSDLLLSCLDVEEASSVIGDAARQLFPAASGALYLLDSARRNLHLQTHWGEPPTGDASFPPEHCWALRRGKINAPEDGGHRLVCEHLRSSPTDGATCLPMAAQGEILGVVSVYAMPGKTIDDQLSKTFVEQIALALASLKLREMLRSQSIRDPLTGVFNRRFMEESLDRELQKAARNGRPLGALMIDIDHFKGFNDSYGHDAGDAVLKEVGAFLRNNTRGADIACRYGGEEFAIIMPEASLQVATQRAEQLHQKIKLVDFRSCGIAARQVTISVGVAAVPDHGSTIASLLKVADTALYKAKADGRDHVVVGVPMRPELAA